jgi:hypothetical protein
VGQNKQGRADLLESNSSNSIRFQIFFGAAFDHSSHSRIHVILGWFHEELKLFPSTEVKERGILYQVANNWSHMPIIVCPVPVDKDAHVPVYQPYEPTKIPNRIFVCISPWKR